MPDFSMGSLALWIKISHRIEALDKAIVEKELFSKLFYLQQWQNGGKDKPQNKSESSCCFLPPSGCSTKSKFSREENIGEETHGYSETSRGGSLQPSFSRKVLGSHGYSSHTFQPSCLCNAKDGQIIALLHYKTGSWMWSGTQKWKPCQLLLENHHMKPIVHFLFSPLATRMKGMALPTRNIPISNFT